MYNKNNEGSVAESLWLDIVGLACLFVWCAYGGILPGDLTWLSAQINN